MDNVDLTRSIVWQRINSSSFSLYLPKEIRKLSVKQITETKYFDEMGEPASNGLYDLALGPIRGLQSCPTCNQIPTFCPGHLGHIELKFSLYNPVLFNILIKLLKLSCLYCSGWIVGKREVFNKTILNKI